MWHSMERLNVINQCYVESAHCEGWCLVHRCRLAVLPLSSQGISSRTLRSFWPSCLTAYMKTWTVSRRSLTWPWEMQKAGQMRYFSSSYKVFCVLQCGWRFSHTLNLTSKCFPCLLTWSDRLENVLLVYICCSVFMPVWMLCIFEFV